MSKKQTYTVEIFGYMEIEAASKEEAIQEAKNVFAAGEADYSQLSFEVTYPESE